MTTFGAMGGARRVAGMRSFGLRVRPSGFWALRAGTMLHVVGSWPTDYWATGAEFWPRSDVAAPLHSVFERRPRRGELI